MLKCRDVPAEVSLAIDDELSWRRRLNLRVHVLMCQHCRRYLRQLKRLSRAWGGLHSPASDEEVAEVLDNCCVHGQHDNS
jgi:anti-sigma factor RsiW